MSWRFFQISENKVLLVNRRSTLQTNVLIWPHTSSQPGREFTFPLQQSYMLEDVFLNWCNACKESISRKLINVTLGQTVCETEDRHGRFCTFFTRRPLLFDIKNCILKQKNQEMFVFYLKANRFIDGFGWICLGSAVGPSLTYSLSLVFPSDTELSY